LIGIEHCDLLLYGVIEAIPEFNLVRKVFLADQNDKEPCTSVAEIVQ
jgi:hypothetical protein